jgi:response regulator RpfG family c-di-GMP phosphodiesterase
VLCVDDDPKVVEALALNLRTDYDVHTACGGQEALDALAEMNGAAVVISDMRMPGMDGATLLSQVMQRYPDATRILLTGEAGRDAAVLAVNEGNIFRFLTKPCPPERLKKAVDAGLKQHQLISAERNMMHETLVGCIEALVDVLAITNPVAFGRARRIKRLVVEFAATIDCGNVWPLEAAAMLSQIGYMSLPMELVDKIYYGERLTSEEKTLASGVPRVAIQLLEHIPRLEPVMQILSTLGWTDAQIMKLGEGSIGISSRILGLILEYDTLIAQGRTPTVALQSLRTRATRFHAALIEKFAIHLGAHAAEPTVLEMPLRQVLPGMTILQDVRTHMGTLLVPKGFEVTDTLLTRIPNFGPELLAESVRVLSPDPATERSESPEQRRS